MTSFKKYKMEGTLKFQIQLVCKHTCKPNSCIFQKPKLPGQLGQQATRTTLVKITSKTCLTCLSTVYPIGKDTRTMNMFLKELLAQTTPHRYTYIFASGCPGNLVQVLKYEKGWSKLPHFTKKIDLMMELASY